jgi:hypothetical protein
MHPALLALVDRMAQHPMDLGPAGAAVDPDHQVDEVPGVADPAAGLALLEAAIEDELHIEPAEPVGLEEHLALDAAGSVPGRPAARRGVEREDQPAAAAARPG